MAVPTKLISGSVGFGGANKQTDVKLVQKLLNAVPTPKGGPTPLLDVDGLCGPLTCGAIKRFQFTNGTGYTDGRIDPGYKTEQTLIAVLNTLGVLAGLLGLGGGSTTPTATPPVVSNANTPIRRRFMQICRDVLPPLGQLTASTKEPGATGTGCGVFPGRVVFERVPVIPPYKRGAFKVNVPGSNFNPCYLTSPMTIWEKFAQQVDKQYSARTWVPFVPGIRPLPGDIYVLHKLDNPSKFAHVGVIVDATGDEWTTADGGQGDGWQKGFVKRKFRSDGWIDGEAGDPAVVRGWVNLDALYAVAIAAFPAAL